MSPSSPLRPSDENEKAPRFPGVRVLPSPLPAHLPPRPADTTLLPLSQSLRLSHPHHPADPATNVTVAAAAPVHPQCSLISSESSSLASLRIPPGGPGPVVDCKQPRHHCSNLHLQSVPSQWARRATFCAGAPSSSYYSSALSSAVILVGGMLTLTLVPSWIGFRVLKDVGARSLPPFWYPTLVGAFTSLVIGIAFACVVGVRAARHAQEIPTGLAFLMEDWVGRAAVAGGLVLGIFALPIGMAVFGRASTFRAVDGLMMQVVGLGILSVLGVGGIAGYVLWHSVHDEWRRRKLSMGFKD